MRSPIQFTLAAQWSQHRHGISQSYTHRSRFIVLCNVLVPIDPAHKSPNAPDKYPTMHHLVIEMCTFLLKIVHCGILHWCIVGFVRQSLFVPNLSFTSIGAYNHKIVIVPVKLPLEIWDCKPQQSLRKPHNHNKAKHCKTVCIFHGIYCIFSLQIVMCDDLFISCFIISPLSSWGIVLFIYKCSISVTIGSVKVECGQ